MKEESEICEFYQGQNVFLTGGSGFMGKILIEKLLRSTQISTIYLLLREKKGQNVQSRLDRIFENVVFDKLRDIDPQFRDKIVPISGDCSLPGLGLKSVDLEKVICQTNIVFHLAATVRFDENLKLAYTINVRGTEDLLEIAKQMRNLKSLVYISTAYANCPQKVIGENFETFPIHYASLGNFLQKISKNEAEKITPNILGKWPNTYTFTKAMAESIVEKNSGSLPLGVYRPGIVISTYKEPIPGWCDNLYGPMGATAGCASGLIRVFPCDEEKTADVVPVDTCIAGIIASAWDIYKEQKIQIYNYISSAENPITWGEFHEINKRYGKKYPLQKAVWTIKFKSVQNPILYFILRFLVHIIPAFFVDALLVTIGQKPKLLSLYRKVHKLSDVLSFFSLNEWQFENGNTVRLWRKMNAKDRDLFPLSMTQVPWLLYSHNFCKGVRMYVVGDPITTLYEAKCRMKIFDLLHTILELILFIAIFTVIWMATSQFFSVYITSPILTPTLHNTSEDILTRLLN